jgi:hypothetical protein
LDIGKVLGQINHCTKWKLGDWLRFGNERKWGEMYDQAVQFGFSYQSARDAVCLASDFPLSRRRDNLSWSHHREVASLDPFVADRLLDEATTKGWAVKKLRRQVSNFKAAKPAVAFSLDDD